MLCDDDDVAHLYFACGGAVEADTAACAFALADIGFETLSIVDVHDLDFLALDDGIFEDILCSYSGQ